MPHLFIALTSLALAGQTAPEANPDWAKVINGTEVQPDAFPSAVAIGFDASDFPGAGSQALQATCSASLITSRMLLTAAHCTEEYVRQGIPEAGILSYGAAFFGTNVNTGDVDSVGFNAFVNHPKYGGSGNPQYDIGVIVLDENVDVTPTWFATEELTSAVAQDETVTSVGYGSDTYYNGPGSGVKRKVRLVIDAVSDQFLTTYATTNPTNGNVCSGDSGGPQYFRNANGTLVQWGVHSNVFGGQSERTVCNTASNSTNVGTFANWVLKHIEDEHGTTDRCEVQGAYGNRICDTDCVDEDVDCVLDLDEDGIVSDEELEGADSDNDGVITVDEAERHITPGCSQTGSAPLPLAVLGLVGLALRRRRYQSS